MVLTNPVPRYLKGDVFPFHSILVKDMVPFCIMEVVTMPDMNWELGRFGVSLIRSIAMAGVANDLECYC